MKRKSLAIAALLMLLMHGRLTAAGQESDQTAPVRTPVRNPAAGQAATHAGAPGVQHPVGAAHTPAASSTARPAPAAAGSASLASPGSATPPADCESGPCDYQPAHISIATPAPAPPAWPWQERIAWVANIVLVILGYAGIAMALSLLKKIERQTQYAEAAAQAAAETAQAAAGTAQAVLTQVQAVARAERPWVLVSVEHSRRTENGFMVVATNRGRTPARIVAAVDKLTFEADQTNLPETPLYDDAKPNAALASVILLPGESTGIKPFTRDEVKGLCETTERLKKVENWDEVILLYGKIVYQELIGEAEAPQHETGWCCWYIHGRQNSGMVMAGSPAYNRHT